MRRECTDCGALHLLRLLCVCDVYACVNHEHRCPLDHVSTCEGDELSSDER